MWLLDELCKDCKGDDRGLDRWVSRRRALNRRLRLGVSGCSGNVRGYPALRRTTSGSCSSDERLNWHKQEVKTSPRLRCVLPLHSAG